ncbi:phage tail protein [Acidovorax sp. SUPP3334]|uniref:phage tail protein n=1 Tax=Acidovorax sp. SUPP3334 TaxID=2920881 RepID=UPI0023DE5E23|nr:phage tail protein [Acidovorax sp. SUPP3334]GKT21644.1 phage tail protein [Acidovorax sp. SUPP3334]
MADLLIQPSLGQDANLVALARLPERITHLDMRPLLVYDVANVAASALPYLAEQFNIVGPVWQYLQDDDARRAAILGAIAWHKAKGTPWSITEALRWIGVPAVPDDLRSMPSQWAAYELVLQHPPAPGQVPAIVALAQFAAPARAHLVRVYNALNDVRPIVLDRGPALDAGMLDGYSGVPGTTGVVESFGIRRGGTLPTLSPGSPVGIATHVRVSVSRYDDMPVLDVWRLDSKVLSGLSGGSMELVAHISTALQPGGGTLLSSRIPTSVSAWTAPPAVGWRVDTAAKTAPVPIHPARYWNGPWDGPWREHFQLISYEEP